MTDRLHCHIFHSCDGQCCPGDEPCKRQPAYRPPRQPTKGEAFAFYFNIFAIAFALVALVLTTINLTQ